VPDRRDEPSARRPAAQAANPAHRRPDQPIVRRLAGGLSTCRKFAPAARNYTACRLMTEVGLRVNEACKLDPADIKWELGRFGKLHPESPAKTRSVRT
jgi:integrase